MKRVLVLLSALIWSANTGWGQNPLQDYVLEVRGDTLVIADFFDAGGVPSTLGAVIQAETDAGNVPEGRVYMLRAGTNGSLESGNQALYLFDAAIPEQGRPLVIVGERCGGKNATVVSFGVTDEAPNCRPPTIAGYQNQAGDPVEAVIYIDDDLTLKNLYFTSAHTQGQSNWSMVEVNGDNITVVFDNVIGEHNRWTWINANGNPGLSLYIYDSYFLNATDQPSRRNGGVYDAVDVPTELVWVENSTHLQNQGMQYKFRNFAPSKVVFNHNTFVNCAGQLFLSFGYLTHMVVTNNLFVNSNYLPYYPGLDYTEMYSLDPNDPNTDLNEFQPHGIINLNYLPKDENGNTYAITAAAWPETQPFNEADRKILVDLNGVYWDPQLLTIADALNADGVEGDVCEADGCVTGNPSLNWTSQAILANERTLAMFQDDEQFPYLVWGTWYQAGDPQFVKGPEQVRPNVVQELYDWGYNSASSGVTTEQLLPKIRMAGNEAGNEIPDEDPANWINYDWPLAVNLAYTNETYLNGGYNGFPLGDLNWFPEQKKAWLAQRDAEYAAIEAALNAGVPLAVKKVEAEIPDNLYLEQNYPNPFKRTTTIRFALDAPDNVELVVYDLLGRRVATLLKEQLSAGVYEVTWDARDEGGRLVSSGVYFYTLKVGSHTETRRMVLQR